MPRTKTVDKTGPSRFTEATLKGLAKDLQSGRLPLMRTQVSDDMVTGLRAMVGRSGRIGFHVSYYVGEERPFMYIGSLNTDEDDYLTIEQARNLAKTIKALGDRGIDVQKENNKRLLRELRDKGTAWRPK